MPLSRHFNGVENEEDEDDVGARVPLLKPAYYRGASCIHGVSGLLTDWWLWEILGAITCIIALAVIAVLLFVYDSSSLPDWPSVFTVRSSILNDYP